MTDLVFFVLEPYSELGVFEKVVGLRDGGDSVREERVSFWGS